MKFTWRGGWRFETIADYVLPVLVILFCISLIVSSVMPLFTDKKYNLGYEDGYTDAQIELELEYNQLRRELEDEYSEMMGELEEKMKPTEEEVDAFIAYDQGWDDGYLHGYNDAKLNKPPAVKEDDSND